MELKYGLAMFSASLLYVDKNGKLLLLCSINFRFCFTCAMEWFFVIVWACFRIIVFAILISKSVGRVHWIGFLHCVGPLYEKRFAKFLFQICFTCVDWFCGIGWAQVNKKSHCTMLGRLPILFFVPHQQW